jgi:RNA polymerase sigma-70 factor (ECF subfamily)
MLGFLKSYEHLSDEALMLHIAAQRSKAFEVLYARYHVRMYRFFYRMLWQDEDLANDFLQDLFLKIIEKPLLYNPEKPFKPWVYSVAHNMCKNTYRSKRFFENIDNQCITIFNHAEYAMDDVYIQQVLQHEIQALDEAHGTCIMLRYFEDMSVKEIAQVLDISDGTVKSRLFYGVKKLEQKMKWCKNFVELHFNEA